MELQARQHVVAPRAFVFDHGFTFEIMLELMERRGAVLSDISAPGGAQICTLTYRLRDMPVSARLAVAESTPGERLRIAIDAPALAGEAAFAFADAPASGGWPTTEVAFAVTLAPRSFQGRLVMGTLQLARARLDSQLRLALAAMARNTEAEWRSDAAQQRQRGSGPGPV